MPSGDSWAFSPIFSPGAHNAIVMLNPGKRPEGTVGFPYGVEWPETDLRVAPNETVEEWFRRVVGERKPERRIEKCAIEDNAAFFARVQWSETGIDFCRLQMLVTEGGDLMDLYLGSGNVTGTYYRLDLDVAAPGPIFKEPLPHIHCIPDGSPRFPFVPVVNEFLPITFLEFVYLNHFHDKWVAWAESECSARGGALPFDGIVEHFNSGTIVSKLEDFRTHLKALKTLLSAAKRERIPNPPKLHNCVADLNYWPVHSI